ncbi:hypothetical protein [Limnofasciculus baicalensis]|uniref:Uncharacterized protein n=1 Tax=Limnofasciculus baicalensis BBK-W-15 TaxID=2699891 RepID=A0AAE3GUK8_9CYAN|nr:hypothetical protein [Limnofasciculus baicalensis]MCP2730744.1 hypothetical protein [Limnofasciculus baicalensis BBK-W-15]
MHSVIVNVAGDEVSWLFKSQISKACRELVMAFEDILTPLATARSLGVGQVLKLDYS